LADLEKAEKRIDVRLSPAGINKRILIFAALVAATAVFLRPLQLSILERLDRAKNDFIGQVEQSLGRKIKYGTIRPSFFGELDIRDLLILREDDSESLSISRLRLSYSLFDIIRGNILNSFKSVRIDRPVLSLDFRLDADLLERFSSPGTGETQASAQNGSLGFRELLPENFSIRIWDGEWELSGSFGSFKIHSVGVDASLRRKAITFQGRWAAYASVSGDRGMAAFFTQASSPVFEADMRGQINGEYSGETDSGSAVITIPSFAGDFFAFNPLSFNLFFSGGRLEILKTYDRSPAAFSLVYDLPTGTFRSRLEGENFSPSDFLSFTGAWRDLNPALAFRVSGNAVFEKEISDDLQFSVNFSGAGSGIYPESPFLNSAFLEIIAAGSANSVNIENFAIHSPNGSLDFHGGLEFNEAGLYQAGLSSIAPYGALSLSSFRFHGDSGISGDLRISTNGNEIGVYSGNLTAGNVKLSSMDLSVISEDNGLGFVLSVLEAGEQKSDNMNSYIESSDNNKTASARLTGSLDYEPRQVQANLLLDSFPVGNILGFVEPLARLSIPRSLRSAADDLSLTTEVFFSTDYEHILYNAPNVEAIYKGLFDILAVASLSGTDRGIDLNTCRVSFGNETAEIIGSADFSDINDVSLFLEASFGNLTYLFDGMILDQKDVSIRGSYGLQVSFSSGLNGSLSGFARGDGIPIPAGITGGISGGIPLGILSGNSLGGERYATLGFLFSMVRDSPSSWRAAFEKFELTGLATPNSTNASLRFTGDANERGLVIPDMVFDDGRGSLAGKVNLEWDAAYENFSFAADIAGNSYNEIYNLAGTYRDKRLDLSLSGQRVQFNHFTTRNAVADGSLRISWESPESFEAEAVVSSFALYHQNEVIRASANFSVNNDEFIARQARINYAGLEAYLPLLRIDREAANAETELQISGRFSERPIEILSTGNAAFNSSTTWIDLFREFGSLDGALYVSRAQYDTVEADPFDFVFKVRQENEGFSLSLNGGPRNMVRFRYNPETAEGGAFYAALSAPSPVRGTVTGTIDSDYIEASTADLYVDMAALWRFIPPLDFLAFPGGIVTASIRVAGPLDEPEFFGNARGTSLQILVPQYIPDPIRTVPLNISLNGYEMSFDPVAAVVGQGRGTVSGWARFDQWIPNTFTMDIQVPQNSPIPYDLDISGVLANGLVYGNLDMSLEDFVFSIKGDLTAQDTEISLNSNELNAQESRPSMYEEPFISVISDIALRAGRRVDFFWPSVDFPMLQASADLGTGIHITTDAVAQRYSMIGDVKLRSGEIFYLERNFYIREGTLFFRENETQFDPFITARAELRDQADIGPVTISMMIDNAPLRSFTPRFISSPSLSQMEIYSILGQNPQGTGDSRNLATSAFFDSLAQFTVIGRLQRQVRNFLGLDMLSLRTQLFQNMLISVSGGRLSGNSTGREYRVGNYFDNTTVFVGKFFGAELFGEAMFSLKYDENRLDWGGLVIEPEFGLEMRNPLFDIRFTMVPTHPENMYIDDVSFSFIWRRSF
jgi:hypothetical protein